MDEEAPSHTEAEDGGKDSEQVSEQPAGEEPEAGSDQMSTESQDKRSEQEAEPEEPPPSTEEPGKESTAQKDPAEKSKQSIPKEGTEKQRKSTVKSRKSVKRSGDEENAVKKKKFVTVFPFRAKKYDEQEIMKALCKVPPKHNYFGFIFSKQTERPSNIYHNYFLPIVNQPSPRQHVQLIDAIIPSNAIAPANEAPRNLMPLSTVKVQWSSKHRLTAYKSESIYAYLQRFGPIDVVYALSVNSSLVVFSTLQGAQSAVQAKDLGMPWDPLIASWLEPRMRNYAFFRKYADIEKDNEIMDSMVKT